MVSHPVGAGGIPSGLVTRTRPLNDPLEDQCFAGTNRNIRRGDDNA